MCLHGFGREEMRGVGASCAALLVNPGCQASLMCTGEGKQDRQMRVEGDQVGSVETMLKNALVSQLKSCCDLLTFKRCDGGCERSHEDWSYAEEAQHGSEEAHSSAKELRLEL